MRLLISFFACSTALLASSANAQDVGSLDERFGARVSIRGIRLSPSGEKLSFITPMGGDGEAAVVIDLNNPGERKTVFTNMEPMADISWCDWPNETRLICGFRATKHADGMLISYSRLVIANTDGSDAALLSAKNGIRARRTAQNGGNVIAWSVEGEDNNKILMTRDFVPHNKSGTLIGRMDDGLGVELVDVVDLKRKKVESARKEAMRYIADTTGHVRLSRLRDINNNGYLTSEVTFRYRPKGGGRWTTLTPASDVPDDFRPLVVDTAMDAALGFGNNNGFDALYSVALNSAGTGKILLSKPGFDVDQLLRLGVGGRVVGASYATEKRVVEFFDEELKTLSAALQDALPGRPLIDILDASDDESKLLLVASSDTNPGMVYLYHKDSHQLEEILSVRPQLNGMEMGLMKPVNYPATDGTNIPAYLTLPPGSDGKGLPAIVMPHGGPSSRDEWGFDWLVQYFVHRGYAVLQPNFRGSSGYGNEWFQENGFKSWPVAIDDVNDAGRWLVSEGITSSDTLAIVGWSYGGYAALQSAVVDPTLYKAVVAIAPVTDLDEQREDSRRYTNFQLVNNFIGQGDHIASGSPARHAEQFVAPVMLLHGDFDENVDVRHSRRMAKALERAGKKVEYIEFKDLAHSLDRQETRSTMLKRIDSFIKASIGR